MLKANLTIMVMDNRYCFSNKKVAKIARSMVIPDRFWDNTFELWLKQEVLELGQVEASKYAISYDSSEPRDFEEFDRMVVNYKAYYLSGLEVSKVRPGLRDAFVAAYQAYQEAYKRLNRLLMQGFWFRCKYRKVLREARERCEALDKEYSLADLVAIACSFYVEQGRGDLSAANKYFLG